MDELTHLNSSGEARMVDVGQKADTRREAVVKGRITMKPTTLEQIKTAGLKKGDALAVARVAGIMAAKKTPDLIPLCHPILIDDVTIDFDLSADDSVGITTTVRSSGKTGVEMEAMVSTSVAALTIYDMVKSVDRGITITEIYLETKKGGKSGVYQRK
jgi:cyclic pyranopterin phosphate synthase|tara:strand:+ start:883 stop:1356 length:474 start_codon:yes stop_codon:yes gene_type:complete